jgi:endogenous inhibitor of DNA gyrase (YacG/DUF329 family)
MPKSVACPTCAAEVAWVPDNKFRPFCSERCKLIDLGAWATEAYRVPVKEEPDPGEGSPSSQDPG